MAKGRAPKGEEGKGPRRQDVAVNRRARFKYEILETLEAGIELRGTEVKSLREGKAALQESYARFRGNELFLIKCHVPEYLHGSDANHDPVRPRRLLLHRSELRRLRARVEEKGLTLLPLALYFNPRGRAKLELALGRGRRLVDKRDAIKRREAKRDIARASRR